MSYNWQDHEARWHGLFETGIKKILKQVHPGITLESPALKRFDQQLLCLFAHLASALGRFPANIEDCQRAIDYVMPEDLAEWALQAAERAEAEFSTFKKKGPIGTEFAAEKIHAKINKEDVDGTGRAVSIEVTLFLLVAVDYIAADVLKLAGNFVEHCNGRTISAESLNTALSGDAMLRLLFDKVKRPPDGTTARLDLKYPDAVRDMLAVEQTFMHKMELMSQVYQRTLTTLDDVLEAEVVSLLDTISSVRDFSFNMVVGLETALEASSARPRVGEFLEEAALTFEYQALLTYISEVGQKLQEHQKLMQDAALRRQLNERDPLWLPAVQFHLPTLLVAPALHLKHHVEAVEALVHCGQLQGRQHELQRLRTALENLRPATRDVTGEEYSFLRDRENFLQFPSVVRRQCLSVAKGLERRIEGLSLPHHTSELLYTGRAIVCATSSKKRNDRTLYVFEDLIVATKGGPDKEKLKELYHLVEEPVIVVDSSASPVQLVVVTTQGKITIEAPPAEWDQWFKALSHKTIHNFVERMFTLNQQDFASQMAALLPSPLEYRFATPDSEANILFDEKESEARGFRVVKAGTLEKLVELLTHPQHTDTEYLRHFLTTYRSFCDSERLLELLLERYDVPDAEAVRHDAKQARFFHKQYRSPVRLRVINVLKQWVEKHFYDFQAPQARPSDPVVVSRQSTDLLKRLLNFSKEVIRQDPVMARACQPIIRAVKRQLKGNEKEMRFLKAGSDAPPVAMLIPDTTAFKRHLLNFHPQEVARQMTIIEFHLYKRIWPSELVGLMWTRRDKWQHAPNVLNMTVRSTLVTRWLTRCIVETANLNERVDLISMIVEILKELRSLNNFNGMMEVVSALNSAAVRRLNHAWAEVNPRRRALFDECVEQLMGGTNYSRLRQAIEHAPAPKIPFFGMYLTDMTFIEEGSSDTIPSPLGGVPLINFSKRRLLARTTGTIQQYQNQQYVLAEWPLLQTFLIDLPTTIANSEEAIPFPSPDASSKDIQNFDDAIYQLSLRIEPRGMEKEALPSYASSVTSMIEIKARKDFLIRAFVRKSKTEVRLRTESGSDSINSDEDRRSSLSSLTFSPIPSGGGTPVRPGRSSSRPIMPLPALAESTPPVLPPRSLKPAGEVDDSNA